jgi:hypothetical protein
MKETLTGCSTASKIQLKRVIFLDEHFENATLSLSVGPASRLHGMASVTDEMGPQGGRP